jgi:hypothetical protein
MRAIQRMSLVAVLCCTACFKVGPSTQDLSLVTSPNGARVDVQTNTQRVSGELLAVRDSGIVISLGGRVALVPYPSVRRVMVAELGQYSVGAGTPSPENRAKLNLVSRYPQGIGAELERRLLVRTGQTSLEVVR